jgi:hypothetical protein
MKGGQTNYINTVILLFKTSTLLLRVTHAVSATTIPIIEQLTQVAIAFWLSQAYNFLILV